MGNGDRWVDINECPKLTTLEACEEFFLNFNHDSLGDKLTPQMISQCISAMSDTITLLNANHNNYYEKCKEDLEYLAIVLKDNVAIHKEFPDFFKKIKKNFLDLLQISSASTLDALMKRSSLRAEITQSFQDFMPKAFLKERQVSFGPPDAKQTVYIPNAGILLDNDDIIKGIYEHMVMSEVAESANYNPSLVEKKSKCAAKLNEQLTELVTTNDTTMPQILNLAYFKKILDHKASEFEPNPPDIAINKSFIGTTRVSIPEEQESVSAEPPRDILYDALDYALNNVAEDIKGRSASIFDVKNIDGAEETIKKITAFTGVSIDKEKLLAGWQELTEGSAKEDFVKTFKRELAFILDGGLLQATFLLKQYIALKQDTPAIPGSQDDASTLTSQSENTEDASINTTSIPGNPSENSINLIQDQSLPEEDSSLPVPEPVPDQLGSSDSIIQESLAESANSPTDQTAQSLNLEAGASSSSETGIVGSTSTFNNSGTLEPATPPNQSTPSTRPVISGSRWGRKKDSMHETIFKDANSDIASVAWKIDLQTKKLDDSKSIERLVKGFYRSLVDLYRNDKRALDQGLQFKGLNMNVAFNDDHPAYKAALLIAVEKANHYLVSINGYKEITLTHEGKRLSLNGLEEKYSSQSKEIKTIYNTNYDKLMIKPFAGSPVAYAPTSNTSRMPQLFSKNRRNTFEADDALRRSANQQPTPAGATVPPPPAGATVPLPVTLTKNT